MSLPKKENNPTLPELDMPPIEEAVEELEEQKTERRRRKTPEQAKQSKKAKPTRKPKKSEEYYPELEEDLEESKQHKYIDKKNKKVIPTGGKKSRRRKVKASEFDDRKNTLAVTRIMRAIVMLIILGLFGFGIKNTFFPSHVYTSEEIKAFARAGAGQTKFPKERGISYVENFMEAYLTIDPENAAQTKLLATFYGKNAEGDILTAEELRMIKGKEAKQKVIIAPRVFDSIMATDHSALFKVSAYVSDTDGVGIEKGEMRGRWVSFAVNVYYDEEIDSLAITRDSPSRIPAYEIQSQAILPTEADLGDGVMNTDILSDLIPTIHGYVSAYADASINYHEGILQYVKDKNDPELYGGFGGTVKLADTPDKAINKVAYNSDKPGEYKVDVNVRWVEAYAKDGDNAVSYNSRYVMTIEDVGEGKYLVSSFKPYIYSAKQ